MKDKRKLILIIAFLVLITILVINYFPVLFEQKKPTETPLPKPVSKETPAKVDIAIKPVIQYYESENLRDPFAPLIIRKQVGQKSGSILENYDIEELKLTGILNYKKGYLALIQTPDGRFHIVKEKDKVGTTGGMIVKIHKDFIEIKEPPLYGGISPKIKQLKLRTEEEQ